MYNVKRKAHHIHRIRKVNNLDNMRPIILTTNSIMNTSEKISTKLNIKCVTTTTKIMVNTKQNYNTLKPKVRIYRIDCRKCPKK